MPDTQQEAEVVPLACLLTGEDLAARGEVVRSRREGMLPFLYLRTAI